MIKKILLLIILVLTSVSGFIFIKKYSFQQIKEKTKDTSSKFEIIQEIIAPKPTKILDTGLPNKHLIEMAFVPQSPEKNWDQPWQDACEEASLLTVDFYYKNQNQVSVETAKNAILDMIKFEDTKNFTHDMDLDQMSLAGEQYLGYKSKIIDKPTVEEIKEYLSQNVPIIVTANGKVLYLENRHFKSGGPYYHSLVILGYDDDRQQFTVHDVGTQFGPYFKYSYKLLMESIHDFPESGQKEDINSGQKRVLILLK